MLIFVSFYQHFSNHEFREMKHGKGDFSGIKVFHLIVCILIYTYIYCRWRIVIFGHPHCNRSPVSDEYWEERQEKEGSSLTSWIFLMCSQYSVLFSLLNSCNWKIFFFSNIYVCLCDFFLKTFIEKFFSGERDGRRTMQRSSESDSIGECYSWCVSFYPRN